MLKHEAKLIDPTAEEIVSALTETTAAANKRCRTRLFADSPELWQKFARDTAKKPEGYAMFRGGRGGVPATQILAAWWTDAIGRKHVVLRGRRVEHDEAKRLLQKDELDKRTPLWHAYPEYVCRRTVGKESQIVCACGCGAVGTPESLGWMGETCGPCFDRKEELGAGGLSANTPGVLYGDRDPLGVVACSPDGNRVAAVEGFGSVTYWDIASRTRTTVKFSNGAVSSVGFTSDGRHLLAAGLVVVAGLFAAFDVTTDPIKRVDVTEPTDISWVIPLGDPTQAFVTRWRYGEAAVEAAVIRVPSGENVRTARLTSGTYRQFALSHDRKRLALFGYDNMTIRDAVTLQRTPTPLPPTNAALGAFSHDDARFLTAAMASVCAQDIATGKEVAKGWLDGKKGAPAFEDIRSLAVDPAGEWVYVGSRQGKLYVFAADALKLRAVFDWHLGMVTGLAASADGSRLFSSAGDGCVKVWPIRDLMKGM